MLERGITNPPQGVNFALKINTFKDVIYQIPHPLFSNKAEKIKEIKLINGKISKTFKNNIVLIECRGLTSN